ncbi:MAG: right-handed parallel beta-helix repeat-containing protein [bacterium]
MARGLAATLCALLVMGTAGESRSLELAAVPFDLQAALDRALAAGEKRIVVPPGRYRVTPKHGQHLRLENLTDIQIIADGVEMVCSETTRGIVFENCRSVRLQGLTIDYDPLPFTEARITALAPDKSWVEFAILDGYPDHHLVERVEIFDPATGELRRPDAAWAETFESLGGHRYRIAKRAGYRFDAAKDLEQVGDILVTNDAFPDDARGHAVWLERCTDVQLEDVTLYASPLFGFAELQCAGVTYRRCRADRRAPADDPVQRGFARLRSLDADAFHSTEATRGPSILDCTAKFQGDDCVNIHGTYHLIVAASGDRLRIVTPGRLTIEAGDPVEFLPFDGPRPPDAVAQGIEPDAPATDAERAFIRGLSLHADLKGRLLSAEAKVFRVTLDRTVALPPGSAIGSANRTGNGFVVQGCDFGHDRSRGILIKASHGRVSGNRITGTWSSAVLVAPEYWWLESGSSCDVEIRGNTITACRATAIEVVARGGDGRPLPAGAHRDIRIDGNVITASPAPTIRVESTEGESGR